jgi:hypothetical protein
MVVIGCGDGDWKTVSDQRVKREMKKLDRSGRERRGDLPMDLSLFKNIIMLKKKLT